MPILIAPTQSDVFNEPPNNNSAIGRFLSVDIRTKFELLYGSSISTSQFHRNGRRFLNQDIIATFEAAKFFHTADDVKNRIGVFIEPEKFEHHNYNKLIFFMHNLANEYPHLTYLYSIGKSTQQRDLY
uniref:Uncharacterized protein n=1 Tax=Ascaris lumbricoides TaxID=6252 RepID=A0A9J2Q1P4_ASCLU